MIRLMDTEILRDYNVLRGIDISGIHDSRMRTPSVAFWELKSRDFRHMIRFSIKGIRGRLLYEKEIVESVFIDCVLLDVAFRLRSGFIERNYGA